MTVLGTLPSKEKIKVKPIVILRILQVFDVLILLAGVYGIFIIAGNYKELEPLTSSLNLTSIYPTARNSVRAGISTVSSDQKNQFLKSLQQKENLMDVVELNKDAEIKFLQTQNYVDSIQTPYQNLLHYFLLPPLNIWKNKFTGKIDDTLIGQKYLKDNNYLDVNLINKRTNFFKDIGNDSPKNEIKDINISEVAEDPKNGIFTISIDVSFVAQTKRSFLLLIDKLSTTSNKENLGLLNEFFYNIWTVIKERDAGGTGSVSSGGVLVNTASGGQEMGIEIYKWIVDPNNTYIKEQDIIRGIRRFANCESEDMQNCYFKFREKIRNLPSLAYTLGIPTSNKSNELRNFFQNIPPLMNVKGFTFKKMASTNNREENRGYEGMVTVDVYGKSMTPGDVDEIANYLGGICLVDGGALTPSGAMNQLERTIKQATQISQFSNEKSKQLNDLRETIKEVEQIYAGQPGLKKVVKLFELYRMLLDNGLCTPKK